MTAIREFKGQHRFLSNFWPCRFEWEGLVWQSSEAAYQAAKCEDRSFWPQFAAMTPAESKRAGRSFPMRSDWESIKFQVMVSVLRAKFTQNPQLANDLRQTGFAWLEEGNTWGDRTWGVSPPGSGNGSNWLGLALMAVRGMM